jgi:acetyltransferase-like isoleucine patch superfamily enzyme
MNKFKNYLRRKLLSFLGIPQHYKNSISYFRSLGVQIGDNVSIIPPISPVIFSSEPYLVSIGDNTTISFDVVFVTHDAATRVIRNLPDGNRETVVYGTISVGENCFIGCRTTILPNVKIGDNTIIGAGSLVNRDIPSNVIAAGNPCKVICTLDEYREKHKDDFLYMVSLPYEKKKIYLMEKFDIK